jgi:alpha-galactosidase
MIEVNETGDLFQLSTPNTSYAISVYKGQPIHYWWGARMSASAPKASPGAATPPYSVSDDPADPSWSSSRLRLECSCGLAGDLRAPSLAVSSAAGPVSGLLVEGWRVYAGRPSLPGLPAARADKADSETLELVLRDAVSGLRLRLNYSVFSGSDVIARSAIVENLGERELLLDRAASFCLDLAVQGELELLSFEGAWARERGLSRRPLGGGLLSIGSRSGASGHGSSPAAIVARPWTTEESGEAWSAMLSYSGSWSMAFERGETGELRWSGGINPEGFVWRLGPGESFACPEVFLCYSGKGLSALSLSWHDFIRKRVLPPAWAGRERPILINNWEATYFQFDEESLLGLARSAAGLGIELFVLDDGWFGHREDDRSSLGDWTENLEKLPGGLPRLAERVRGLGLAFGLWIEPESVSPESELYRLHPDWCLHLPGRPRAEGRNQLLLDLGREEVRAEIGRRIRAVLSSCRPDYVKWDMNRHLGLGGSEALPGELQGESRHRYILGLYALMEEICSAFPETLFEGCAGGGGRMDPGILHYMPQYWTSDNTDAFARASIQYGTSFFFPPLCMGAHVSAVPNHQTGRSVPLGARSAVSFCGDLGYELDPGSLSEAERAEIRADIAWYKERRELFQLGNYYRLLPSRGERAPGRGDAAWLCSRPDGRSAVLTFIRMSSLANPPPLLLRLRGLVPDALYRLTPRGGAEPSRLSGSELMSRGYEFMPGLGDGWTLLADISAVGDAPLGEAFRESD